MGRVSNLDLAERGWGRIYLAKREMPVLVSITENFKTTKPLAGLTVGACLHVTKETAVLVEALVSGGARVFLCGSNPLSTQDDVAVYLDEKENVDVFAWRGQKHDEYLWCLNKVPDSKPQIIIDDGADLISLVHSRPDILENIIAGQEETTTGVMRLKAMAKENKLNFPVVAVNDTPTKCMFDNYYGTGQSTIDALMRTTNILLAGKTMVIAGYGHCGQGIAKYARGMGAKVIVTEVDWTKALRAAMDGFQVMSMWNATKFGDVFITATGNRDVITPGHIDLMKNGVILGNSGHFNIEIDVAGLENIARGKVDVGNNLQEYTLKHNRKVYLIAEGRLMNLVAAEGHPSSVMDMSFANQALVCEWLALDGKNLKPGVYEVPKRIDEKVAELKLRSLGIEVDQLSPTQRKYLESWQEGT